MNKILSIKPVFVFLLLLILFVTLLKSILLVHCSSYYDVGIYSEALKLITLNDLNPYIPGRNIHIFNDHFDPILIPVAMLERFVPAPLLGISFEFLIIALCWLPFKLLVKNKKIAKDVALFSFAFIALNHATVDALIWPFHPTTWACLPLVYLLTFYWLKEWKKMIFATLIFFACREEFPLLGLMLGILLIFEDRSKREQQFKAGVFILATSIAWTYFAFVIRPIYFAGPNQAYGNELIHNFLSNPFAPLAAHFSIAMARMFFSRTLSVFLLIDASVFKRHLPHFLKILWISASVLGIRYASTSWGFHYGTAPVILFLFAFLPALNESFATAKPWRKFAAWAFLLIIYLSPVVKKASDTFIGHDVNHPKAQRCPNDSSRIAAVNEAQSWVVRAAATGVERKKILVENNLAASLLYKTRNVEPYIFGNLREVTNGPFDFVLMEKPPRGDAWPASLERVDALIQLWKLNPEIKVIFDNEHVFLAEGNIKEDR